MTVDDQTETSNTAPVTIKGVCLDSARRLLLCRNHRTEWELPGGRPLLGERFSVCLVREIREETGLTAAIEDLICAYPYQVLRDMWVNVIVYGCQVAQARTPVASSEHDRTAFFDLDELADLAIADGYRYAIEHWAARLPGSSWNFDGDPTWIGDG